MAIFKLWERFMMPEIRVGRASDSDHLDRHLASMRSYYASGQPHRWG